MNTALKTGLLAAAISLSAPFAASAEESSNPLPGTVTGNIAIVSDYVFRGITQTSNNAAVQGGLDWDTGVGLHFGTWASSVNFADGNLATTELDLYGGYGGAIDNFSYDVGFTYYWYPGAPHSYNMWEVYGKAGYNFGVASLTGYVAWSNDAAGLGDWTYTSLTFGIPVVDMLSISGGVGYTLMSGTLKNRTDWNIGTTLKVYDWFDVDARYSNTDIHSLGANADDKIVVKFSRAF